jgi:excisionase family DNA binding protein
MERSAWPCHAILTYGYHLPVDKHSSHGIIGMPATQAHVLLQMGEVRERKDGALVAELDRKVVTTTKAMELLGVSRSTISRLVKDGKLSGYRLTTNPRSELRIYLDSIEEFWAQRQF